MKNMRIALLLMAVGLMSVSCEEEKLDWTDTLPLTESAPFAYTLDDASRTTKASFIRFLQSPMELLSTSVTTDDVTEELLVSSGLPAEALFARMRLKFEIPEDWSDADARKVLAVRYELAIRAESAESYLMVKDISSDLISILNDGAPGCSPPPPGGWRRTWPPTSWASPAPSATTPRS